MYSRFKSLENFGEKELEKLQNSTVAIVGLGATGSVMAEHLARHGIELVLIDRDYLEVNDLYSSNLYKRKQVENSLPKAVAAEEELEEFTETESYVENLNPGNVDILDSVDLILDGTDNLETRFLINEYSKKNRIPWIYTASIAERGYSMLFKKECFNCIFNQISGGSLETCESAGILREISTIAGSLSAMKAVRHLTGKEVSEKLETVAGEVFDVEGPRCEVCEAENYAAIDREKEVSAVCGENKYQLHKDIGEEAFRKMREKGNVIADNDYLLRISVNGSSFTLFRSGRAIIEAEDMGHAESIFSEVVGI